MEEGNVTNVDISVIESNDRKLRASLYARDLAVNRQSSSLVTNAYNEAQPPQ
jgi:hypothetical protein